MACGWLVLACAGCASSDPDVEAHRLARSALASNYQAAVERARDNVQILLEDPGSFDSEAMRVNVALTAEDLAESGLHWQGTIYGVQSVNDVVTLSLLLEGRGNASAGAVNSYAGLYGCAIVTGTVTTAWAEWVSEDAACPTWLTDALHEERPDAKLTSVTEAVADG